MTAPEQSVVIGAGPSGLVAATQLAEARRAVTVLEAADKPGGAVRTEELTLPGFRHDTYPTKASSACGITSAITVMPRPVPTPRCFAATAMARRR